MIAKLVDEFFAAMQEVNFDSIESIFHDRYGQ